MIGHEIDVTIRPKFSTLRKFASIYLGNQNDTGTNLFSQGYLKKKVISRRQRNCLSPHLCLQFVIK